MRYDLEICINDSLLYNIRQRKISAILYRVKQRLREMEKGSTLVKTY